MATRTIYVCDCCGAELLSPIAKIKMEVENRETVEGRMSMERDLCPSCWSRAWDAAMCPPLDSPMGREVVRRIGQRG